MIRLFVVAAIICMKRIIATSPSFIYGKPEELVVDVKTLLEEVLACYQKCILYENSIVD